MTRCSEQQALLGFRIEQVRHLLGEGEPQLAAVGQPGALLLGEVQRGDAQYDPRVVVEVHVQVQLAAHHLVDPQGTLDR